MGNGRAGKPVLQWRRGAIREVRNLPDVEEILLTAALDMAEQANRTATRPGALYVADSQRVTNNGKKISTARAAVFPANVEAMLSESQDRTLTRAQGAARRSS